MKNLLLFFLIFFMMGSVMAQIKNERDYYTLYKEGEKFSKPIVYIKWDQEEPFTTLEDGNLLFQNSRYSFTHYSGVHEIFTMDSETISDLTIYNCPDLWEIEHQEFLKRAIEEKGRTGIHPIPPISHTILKIYLVVPVNKKLKFYKVKWNE